MEILPRLCRTLNFAVLGGYLFRLYGRAGLENIVIAKILIGNSTT